MVNNSNKNEVTHQNADALPSYLFHEGTNFRAQEYLGVHKTEDGYVFRVWAPKADRIELVGDFVGWDNGIPFSRITDGGIWECVFLTNDDLEGNCYKFKVFSGSSAVYKADPYATFGETLAKTASKIHCRRGYTWHDGGWLKKRMRIAESERFYPAPLNIYEVHLGSWMRADDGSYIGYREAAEKLSLYVRQMGYTHVELMPVSEYPFDGSWGYQVCGFYAPTSRFGTPEDFKYFVDTLHKAGIGVILDWVPAHFGKDSHGLYRFDGGALYEFEDPLKSEHKSWGTCCFDVGRNEVKCFLISNALYWLGEYHADGLRVDAVASMLYLDFDRKPGEWRPNKYGENRSLEAIDFFRELNTAIKEYFPDSLMIAEESTAWPMVTGKPCDGGLGFDFKWNMGWSNDMFEYVSLDPIARKYHHNKLTFPMMYAFSEHYVLPVSHDEVVHGKKSLIDKMFGSYEQKFALDRAFLTFQMTYPGKKLLFMGCEYGQFREWDYEHALEWFMLDYEKHRKLQSFVSRLNNFYLAHPPLWEDDFSWGGFNWICPNEAALNVIGYRRYDTHGNELSVVINFSAADIDSFFLKTGDAHRYYTVVLDSTRDDVGECGSFGKYYRVGKAGAESGIMIRLPALSALILEPRERKPRDIAASGV